MAKSPICMAEGVIIIKEKRKKAEGVITKMKLFPMFIKSFFYIYIVSILKQILFKIF